MATGLVAGATAAPNPATTSTTGGKIDFTDQINKLYQNTLGRGVEKAGADYYNQQLQSGRTIQDLKGEILNSDEYKTLNEKKSLLDGAKAYYATSQGYDPTDWKVDAQQTAAGQLASLTDPNGQLAQRTMAQSQQESAKRGLVNSSLASTAGLSAVLDKATPIAQADAATYANSNQFNAAAKNTASQFGAQAANTAALQNAQNETGVSQSNAANATSYTIADKNNQSASSIADKNLASQQAIADKNNANQLTITDRNNASQQAISSSSNASQQTIADKNAASQLAVAGLNAETQKFVAGLNNDAQMAVSQLDAATKTNLQNIVSKNSQLLQSNTSAANLVSQYITTVGTIQTNKDMDSNAKAQAIANQAAALQEGLRTVGEISGLGLDLTKYFDAQVSANGSAGSATLAPAQQAAQQAAEMWG